MNLKIGDFEVELTSARTETGWQAEGILPDGHRVRSGPCKSREDAEKDIKQQASARLYPQRRYDVNRPFESILDESEGLYTRWQPAQKHNGTWVMFRYPMEGSPYPSGDIRNYAEVASANSKSDVIEAFLNSEEYAQFRPKQSHVGGSYYGHYPWKWTESMSTIREGKWMKGAINPAHKGYCKPMTKKTCTPQRKALARRFKKGGDLHERLYPELSEADEAVVMYRADQLLEAPGVDEARVVARDYAPPHQNVDPDTEMEMATKSPFSAWEFANRTNRHHPRLQQAVTGSPFERMYRKKFMPPPKAEFYPSDGGSAGGGGGITSV